MAKTIQLPDDVYEKIKRFKKDLSFSEMINILLDDYRRKKKMSKAEFLNFLENLENLYKDREKECVSEKIDEILWK